MSDASKAKGCTCPRRSPAMENGVLYCEVCEELILDRAPKDANATLGQSIKLSSRLRDEMDRHVRSIVDEECLELREEIAALRKELDGLKADITDEGDVEWVTARRAAKTRGCHPKVLTRDPLKFGGRRLDESNPRSHWRFPIPRRGDQ